MQGETRWNQILMDKISRGKGRILRLPTWANRILVGRMLYQVLRSRLRKCEPLISENLASTLQRPNIDRPTHPRGDLPIRNPNSKRTESLAESESESASKLPSSQ